MKTITINGREWTNTDTVPGSQLWVANYFCSDGDQVNLFINEESFDLSCFSGIGGSIILVDIADFGSFSRKTNMDFTQTFEQQCLQIADYLCRVNLCEFIEM